jgi:hypothetical protein
MNDSNNSTNTAVAMDHVASHGYFGARARSSVRACVIHSHGLHHVVDGGKLDQIKVTARACMATVHRQATRSTAKKADQPTNIKTMISHS